MFPSHREQSYAGQIWNLLLLPTLDEKTSGNLAHIQAGKWATAASAHGSHVATWEVRADGGRGVVARPA